MIPEPTLLEQLARFKGWGYRSPRTPSHYPTPLPFVRVKQGPPNVTDCCCFVEGLVVPVSGALWSLYNHRQMMIQTPDRFGPVTALVETEIADELDPDAVPQVWSVVQGWRSKSNAAGGHTFIIADVHDDKVLILEANTKAGLGVGSRGGVGWRRHSHLTSGEVPFGWETHERVISWADVCDWYPHRKVAALRVDTLDSLGKINAVGDLEPEGGGSIRA